jgi:hypothetical protein
MTGLSGEAEEDELQQRLWDFQGMEGDIRIPLAFSFDYGTSPQP